MRGCDARPPADPVVPRLQTVPGRGPGRRADVSRVCRRRARAFASRPGQCRDRAWCRAKTVRRSAGIAATSRKRGRASSAVCWCKRRGPVGAVAGVATLRRVGRAARAPPRAAHRGGRVRAPPQSDSVCDVAGSGSMFDGRDAGRGVESCAQRATSRGVSAFRAVVAPTIVTEIATHPAYCMLRRRRSRRHRARIEGRPALPTAPCHAPTRGHDRRVEMWKSTERIPTFPHAHLTGA